MVQPDQINPSPLRDRCPSLDRDRVARVPPARAIPTQPESVQTRASCRPLDSHPTAKRVAIVIVHLRFNHVRWARA